MSVLETTEIHFTCAWCGKTESTDGEQERPTGWLPVVAHVCVNTSDTSFFVDSRETHFVCSAPCKAGSYAAVEKARVAYAEVWDSRCPRRGLGKETG